MKICIAGKMGSGKDTVADYLVENYGYEKKAFADDMRLFLEAYMRVNKEHKNYRKIMQTFGTDIVRNLVDEDFWLNRLLEQIKHPMIVVSDARFINEVEGLKNKGFITLRIISNEIRREQIGIEHRSETELDTYNKWDYIIENNGSLEELYEKVNLFLHMFQVKREYPNLMEKIGNL